MKRGVTYFNNRIIEILLRNIPTDKTFKLDCNQFFEFLCQVFEETFSDMK